MIHLLLVTGPEPAIVQELCVRLSACHSNVILGHDYTVERTRQWLEASGQPATTLHAILTVPWTVSVHDWLAQWRRTACQQPLTVSIQLSDIAICLAADSLTTGLDNGTLVGDQSHAERLVETIEVASRVVINRMDTQLVGLCAALQPTIQSIVLPDVWLIEQPYSVHTAWQAIVNEHTIAPPSETRYHLFTTQKPFHTERLATWLKQPLSGLLRARGFTWFHDSPSLVIELSIAGAHRCYRPAGTWWVGMRRSHWPRDRNHLRRIQQQWHPDFGDRLQAVALISHRYELTPIVQGLTQCILTDDELGTEWHQLAMTPDPFAEL